MTRRTRVGAGGKVNVTVPVTAGTEVEVTVEPISTKHADRLSRDERLRIVGETAGSIPDFPYVLSPALDPIPPVDID